MLYFERNGSLQILILLQRLVKCPDQNSKVISKVTGTTVRQQSTGMLIWQNAFIAAGNVITDVVHYTSTFFQFLSFGPLPTLG